MSIISLTSIPPRFAHLGPVLESLVRQRRVTCEVTLYLPKRYRRFPNYDGSIPDVPNGVRVVRVADDFGPASKVLHAIDEYSKTDIPILFCDDDRLFHPGWARQLLVQLSAKPACITALGRNIGVLDPGSTYVPPQPEFDLGRTPFDLGYRVRRAAQQIRDLRLRARSQKPLRWRRPVTRAGRADVLLGFGGAAIRPSFFDSAVFDIPELLWMVDDMWLSGHLARRNVPIWVPARCPIPVGADHVKLDALRTSTFDGVDRAGSNLAAIRYFQDTHGIWMPKADAKRRMDA